MRIKVGATYEVRRHAREMLEAVAKAAEKNNGVRVSNMPGSSGMYRQWAARWLRQMGVPLYARRAGSESVWFLLLDEDALLASEWQARIISDAYAEVCRAHMSLRPHKPFEKKARELSSMAVTLGTWLGYDIDRIVKDLAPVARPQWVDDTINGVVVE